MKRLIVAFTQPRSSRLWPLTAVVDAHPGNVRRSDCTHVDRATGERHRHTGKPYCQNGREGFLSST